MRNWFTSDTHYGHKKIIQYSKRPFKDVDEMDEALIRNWNSVVQPDDIVYHLGDVAFYQASKIDNILRRLNGTKHLCPGNHDKHAVKAQGWASIQHYRELRDAGHHLIVLLHYGMRVWNKSHHGSIQLYGHSHGGLPGNSQSLDVGVDCWNYFPVNFDDIKERLKTLPPYVGYALQVGGGDHHKANPNKIASSHERSL